ncbi:hypothetical protein RJ639_037498 [Escallonia herrerae]|uniref:Uncharacterized protein n=1 Tax=Escallonia herrerae TaxID=1293975 RepID=A0AA89B9X8_9ASTE|nr:hypothetical protein RJ639_037498 [Escallonia herrerae]
MEKMVETTALWWRRLMPVMEHVEAIVVAAEVDVIMVEVWQVPCWKLPQFLKGVPKLTNLMEEMDWPGPLCRGTSMTDDNKTTTYKDMHYKVRLVGGTSMTDDNMTTTYKDMHLWAAQTAALTGDGRRATETQTRTRQGLLELTLFGRAQLRSGTNKTTRGGLHRWTRLPSSGDGQGGSSFATGQSDDELSTNYGGLDLEALSRLDGRRWSSSCRSHDGLELVAVNRDGEEESMTESIRTLSQKYRPMFFEELIGQNIVVQSLMNAILRGRVASLYLFQGPRGTGKTSTARVLTAALNCLASNKTKLCGVCRECSEFILGNVLRQLPYGYSYLYFSVHYNTVTGRFKVSLCMATTPFQFTPKAITMSQSFTSVL